MTRRERYGTRDLAYSGWHRLLEDDLTYIDIDGCEYCRRCREPLALIETARDVGQDYKATTVLRRLAVRAGLPAYLVLYRLDGTGVEGFRVQQLLSGDVRYRSMTTEAFSDLLRSLRRAHHCEAGR